MDPNEQRQKIAEARKAFLSDLFRTFESAEGKSVLSWLHATAATRKPAFLPGDRDPYAAASRDGRKSLVWEIESNLEEARRQMGATPGDKPTASGGPRAGRKRA